MKKRSIRKILGETLLQLGFLDLSELEDTFWTQGKRYENSVFQITPEIKVSQDCCRRRPRSSGGDYKIIVVDPPNMKTR